MKINKIILWSNGTVIVFGIDGNQMPKYQGNKPDATSKLLEDKINEDKDIKYFLGIWDISIQPISRENFYSECWEK